MGFCAHHAAASDDCARVALRGHSLHNIFLLELVDRSFEYRGRLRHGAYLYSHGLLGPLAMAADGRCLFGYDTDGSAHFTDLDDWISRFGVVEVPRWWKGTDLTTTRRAIPLGDYPVLKPRCVDGDVTKRLPDELIDWIFGYLLGDEAYWIADLDDDGFLEAIDQTFHSLLAVSRRRRAFAIGVIGRRAISIDLSLGKLQLSPWLLRHVRKVSLTSGYDIKGYEATVRRLARIWSVEKALSSVKVVFTGSIPSYLTPAHYKMFLEDLFRPIATLLKPSGQSIIFQTPWDDTDGEDTSGDGDHHKDQRQRLIWAAKSSSPTLIRSLLNTGRYDAAFCEVLEQMSGSSARHGRADVIEVIMKFTQRLEDKEFQHSVLSAALYRACIGGRVELADFLTTAGAELPLDAWRRVLLQVARRGSGAVLATLKQRPDIDPNISGPSRERALGRICSREDPALLRLILDHPATDPNYISGEGCTPLLIAIRMGATEMAEVLLASDTVDPNQAGEEHTPLTMAVTYAQVEIVGMLLDKPQTCVDVPNPQGHRPMQIAEELPADDMIALFRKYQIRGQLPSCELDRPGYSKCMQNGFERVQL